MNIENLMDEILNPVPKGRGPISEIDNGRLHNARDQFFQIFEGRWGHIGWKLQICKHPNDLIDIFEILADTYIRNLISIFLRPSSEISDWKQIRKIRFESRKVVRQRYRADEIEREMRESFSAVERAVVNARGRQHRLVHKARKKARYALAEAVKINRNLRKQENDLETRLRNLEASFARAQVFRFLKSKRYEINWFHLANAVAGLPHMGWRRSMQRCMKFPKYRDSIWGQIYKSIRYLAKGASDRKKQSLILHIRKGIPLLPSRYKDAKQKLADDWFYLERAITASCRAKVYPKALSFEIMKRYVDQIPSQSQVDPILAKQFRIPLTKRRA